jgi:hypothetical protein
LKRLSLLLVALPVALLCACALPAGGANRSLHVLFVGNSYTYVNDLPAVMRGLFEARGVHFESASDCPGGATFEQHYKSGRPLQLLTQQHFDWVVLQEQSQLPAYDTSLEQQVLPYARLLDQQARRAGSRVIFYMTWARKNGDSENIPNGDTFTAMQQRLQQGYERLGHECNDMVAPAGLAWAQALATRPTLDLWQGDGSHPTMLGTYLTACVFYDEMTTGRSQGDTFTAGLDGGTAAFLQQTADHTVSSYRQP